MIPDFPLDRPVPISSVPLQLKIVVRCQRPWPTRASRAPGRPSCAQRLARMFNPGCDCGAQPASTMGFAPSRVLMENS
jgi:hypothetical protein